MRTFIALLPDGDLSQALDTWMVRNYPVSGRRVPMQNLHMTVCFLGDTNARQQQFIDQELSTTTIDPMTFSLNELGYFASSETLWLGSDNTPAAYLTLVAKCRRIANRAGIKVDKRPAVPHITLARRVLPPVPSPLDPPDFKFSADTVWLQSSELTPDGPIYRSLRSWPD